MADKKSREVVAVEKNYGGEDWGLYAETRDGSRYAISEAEYSRLEVEIKKRPKPELDFSQVLYEAYSDGTPAQDVDNAKEGSDSNTMSIRVDVDVSEALTGLKAMQREIRETTKATREMEQAYISLSKTGLTPSEIISMTGEEAENYLARHAIIIDGKAVGKVIAPDLIDVSTKEDEMIYYDLSEVPTKQLHEELAKREDVSGPARILINKD